MKLPSVNLNSNLVLQLSLESRAHLVGPKSKAPFVFPYRNTEQEKNPILFEYFLDLVNAMIQCKSPIVTGISCEWKEHRLELFRERQTYHVCVFECIKPNADWILKPQVLIYEKEYSTAQIQYHGNHIGFEFSTDPTETETIEISFHESYGALVYGTHPMLNRAPSNGFLLASFLPRTIRLVSKDLEDKDACV